MKVIETKVFKGKNIYSHKKCIRIDVDLEGYSEIPSKDIEDFNYNLANMIPELKTHRCGIDEEGGFIKRLKEGTYLAHICEHITIAIQNKLGIDVRYGKSREVKGDHYYIIYQYMYENVALESFKLAVDIINALINKLPINYDERIEFLKYILKDEAMGPSAKSICDYASKVGLPVIKIGDGGFYQIGYGKQGRVIESSIGANTRCVSVDISCDKMMTKELLEIQSIPVAKGFKIRNIIDLLKNAEEIGYPVVIKPQYGNKGNGVILNIKSKKELLVAYNYLKDKFKDLMVEKYYKGNDFRVCVVNYKVVAVSHRVPPYVEGDGVNTVLGLVNKLNEDSKRGDDHEKSLTKIKINEEVLKYLKEQGRTLNDVLDNKEIVYLRQNANLSTGGEAIDYTDKICKKNIDLCIRAAKALKLDICGIDICTEDISIPICNDNGIIMEVNAAPGLRMHLNPSKGSARDVGREIVNMLYDDNPCNIPVISVTGTNGKTTTTRVISHTLSKIGYCVGMTSTNGIYIGEECIDLGDDTGFESAKSVLLNPDVDIAVLETARGGMIKKGLAYELADVAIITNITEDHLGVDGIDGMEQLCYVKSLVGEAVKVDGYVVINADDYWSKSILDRIKANIIFFSKDCNNPLLKQKKLSNISIYLKNNNIVVFNRGREHIICNINDVPITLGGKLIFNIENILAVCGALVGMNVDYCMIKNGIMSYLINSSKNVGRFNSYDVNGVNVILDYGHNIEGYKGVLSAIKNISNGKTYGIVGIPGDRSDDMALEIGKITAEYLDYIIIKEDEDLRNRKKGEMAQLISYGISKINSKKKHEIILNEDKALIKALNMAKVGDTIVMFFENMDPLLGVMGEFVKHKKEGNFIKASSLN